MNRSFYSGLFFAQCGLGHRGRGGRRHRLPPTTITSSVPTLLPNPPTRVAGGSETTTVPLEPCRAGIRSRPITFHPWCWPTEPCLLLTTAHAGRPSTYLEWSTRLGLQPLPGPALASRAVPASAPVPPPKPPPPQQAPPPAQMAPAGPARPEELVAAPAPATEPAASRPAVPESWPAPAASGWPRSGGGRA